MGKANKGFDFLGYHCSREGLTVAPATVDRCVTRIRRLDEQDSPRPYGAKAVGVYVSRWWRWAKGGLPDLGPLTSPLRPLIGGEAQQACRY